MGKLPERKNAAAQLRYFHVWDEAAGHEDEKGEAQRVIYLVISV